MHERGWQWSRHILGGLFMLACAGSITTSDTDQGVGSGGASSAVAAAGGAGGSGSDGAGGASAGTSDASSGGSPVAGSGGGEVDGGDDPGAPAEPDPNRVYCDAVTTVFQANCAPSCHGNERVAIGDFAVGLEQAAALVDRASIRNAGCGLLINSRFPAQSLILTKVTGAYRRDIDCGAEMPTGPFGELTGAEIACIADWLQQFQR